MAFIDLLLLPGTVLNTLQISAYMFLSLALAWFEFRKNKKTPNPEMSVWDSHNIPSEIFH